MHESMTPLSHVCHHGAVLIQEVGKLCPFFSLVVVTNISFSFTMVCVYSDWPLILFLE
jgi:hypothetical protein